MSSCFRIPIQPAAKVGEGELQNTLSVLKCSVQDILEKSNSNHRFEILYRNVYTLVRSRYGTQLHASITDLIKMHCRETVRRNILDAFNDSFLSAVNKAWEDHVTAMLMVREVFLYMDRTLMNDMEDGYTYNTGIKIFHNDVIRFDPIRERLTDTLLDIISQERSGAVFDRLALKKSCEMMIGLGINSNCFYYEYFERPFILQAVHFYRDAAQKMLSCPSCDMSAYLRKVQGYLADEGRRVDVCLAESTKPAILRVVLTEMVQNHLKSVTNSEFSGLVYILKNNKTTDLRLMYEVLSQVKGGVDAIADTLSSYLRECGTASVTDGNHLKNPVYYIQGLVDLMDRFDLYLKECFQNDPIIMRMMMKEFEQIVNISSKTAEHLAQYFHKRLKTYSDVPEHETETLLVKAVRLFRYLHHKDVFETWYRKLLATRLLHGSAGREDVENAMFSKFRFECGNVFTFKMDGMLRDMAISRTVVSNYKNNFSHKDESDRNETVLDVRLLTSGYWPFSSSPVNCVIPSDVYSSYKDFVTYYSERHKGRQLTLLPFLGTCNISFQLNSDSDDTEKNRNYILKVSTYQMCLLMLFNEKYEWSYEEMMCKTNIPDKYLTCALQPLTAGKNSKALLNKIPDSTDIDKNHSFKINHKFTSKNFKIKYKMPFPKEDQEITEKKMQDRVDWDRKDKVDAVIVRLMKTRKVMRHDDLVQEATQLLRPRFVPTLTLIKNRIEGLIEREYIERLQEDRKSYKYIA